MADADEDDIPRPSFQTGTDDLEDEAQDFRFLAQLTSSSSSNSTTQSTIPKRGVKDFEPNPTRSQASALEASRLAMHNALGAVRVHSGKNHVVAQYFPDEEDWRWEGSNGRCVVSYRFNSTHSRAMGQADARNWMWFLPEEALYLLERGSLDVRWPDVEVQPMSENTENGSSKGSSKHHSSDLDSDGAKDKVEMDDEDVEQRSDDDEETEAQTHNEPKVGELPMSLQGAYASFIGKSGLTLERYSVYAGLRRSGYIVQRASTWSDEDVYSNGHTPIAQSLTLNNPVLRKSATTNFSGSATLIHRLLSWLTNPRLGEPCPHLGPLVAPGLYRNYNDIFRSLSLVPYHDQNAAPTRTTSTDPKPPFRLTYNIWKPTSAYKKSSPPPPDYRVAVVDARTSSVPTSTQIGELLDSMPADELPRDKRLEARLKHGKRNVLLAVVDMGVVSYLRFSDTCFGGEKLFEEKGRKGSGKKGGRNFKPKGQGQKPASTAGVNAAAS